MDTLEIKGDWNIAKGKVHHWQVTLKVGFELESASKKQSPVPRATTAHEI